MKSHDCIENKTFDEKFLRDQSSNDKFNNGSINEMIFEVTRDFADPTSDWFPFLFYEKIE